MAANKVTVTPPATQTVQVVEEDTNVAVSGTPTVEVVTATKPDVQIVSVGQVGPAGPAGGDIFYTYTQGSASSVWTITHNLGKMPSVTVVDSSGNEVEGDIKYNSSNQVTVTFSAGFAGKAYLN